MAYELGEDVEGVAKLRKLVTFLPVAEPFIGFGESAPVDGAHENDEDDSANRRIEVLFFETGQEPDLALLKEDAKSSELYLPEMYVREEIEATTFLTTRAYPASWSFRLKRQIISLVSGHASSLCTCGLLVYVVILQGCASQPVSPLNDPPKPPLIAQEAPPIESAVEAEPQEPTSPVAPPPPKFKLVAGKRTAEHTTDVYMVGNELVLSNRSCFATVNQRKITAGKYPLPGTRCDTLLNRISRTRSSWWLLAHDKLWSKKDSNKSWHIAGVFPNTERVMIGTQDSERGLALVVPARAPTSSAWQVSNSYEFRRVPGLRWGALPRRTLATSPGTSASFDDFMDICTTRTRLASPRGFHLTETGRILIFGTECERAEPYKHHMVLESWEPGAPQSTIERLPLPGQLIATQIFGDDDIWIADAANFSHFDGKGWTLLPGPKERAVEYFSVAAKGTIIAVVRHWLFDAREVWMRRGGSWEKIPFPSYLGSPKKAWVDQLENIWVTADDGLYSTRDLELPAPLCEKKCRRF